MGWSDWLLSFHVLSAFALIGGIVAQASLQVAATRRDDPGDVALMLRLAAIPGYVVMAGATLALIFGVWLAVELDAYSLTDGWIIASIILWVVASALGGRSDSLVRTVREAAQRGGDDRAAMARLRQPSTQAFGWSAAVLYLAILVLMIWKPGA
mgnify:CR=1 FL=1